MAVCWLGPMGMVVREYLESPGLVTGDSHVPFKALVAFMIINACFYPSWPNVEPSYMFQSGYTVEGYFAWALSRGVQLVFVRKRGAGLLGLLVHSIRAGLMLSWCTWQTFVNDWHQESVGHKEAFW